MSEELCPQRALLDDGPGPCLRLTLDLHPPHCLWCGRELGPDAPTVASLISAEERARLAQWIEFERHHRSPRASIAGADLSETCAGARVVDTRTSKIIHLREVEGSRRTWSGGGSFTLAPGGLPVPAAGAEKVAEFNAGNRKPLQRLMHGEMSGVEEPDDFSTGGPCLDDEPPVLDELRIEIGLWLADRTKDHETIRAIGRLLGVDMGGRQ